MHPALIGGGAAASFLLLIAIVFHWTFGRPTPSPSQPGARR
jgi:hypothetical protein